MENKLVIETDRLLLRPFRETDAEDLYEYLHEPTVNCFACMKIHSLEEAKAEASKRSEDGEFYFAIVLKETGKVIGSVGLEERDEELEAWKGSKGRSGGSYVPKSGDLIFFGDSATKSSHVGLVVYCEGSTVYTVEGNTSQAAGLNTNGGGVYFKSYALSNTRIRGYGVLPYKTNANAIKPDYSCKTFTTGLYVNTNYQNAGVQIQTYRDAACSSKGPKMETNSDLRNCKSIPFKAYTIPSPAGYSFLMPLSSNITFPPLGSI